MNLRAGFCNIAIYPSSRMPMNHWRSPCRSFWTHNTCNTKEASTPVAPSQNTWLACSFLPFSDGRGRRQAVQSCCVQSEGVKNESKELQETGLPATVAPTPVTKCTQPSQETFYITISVLNTDHLTVLVNSREGCVTSCRAKLCPGVHFTPGFTNNIELFITSNFSR